MSTIFCQFGKLDKLSVGIKTNKSRNFANMIFWKLKTPIKSITKVQKKKDYKIGTCFTAASRTDTEKVNKNSRIKYNKKASGLRKLFERNIPGGDVMARLLQSRNSLK